MLPRRFANRGTRRGESIKTQHACRLFDVPIALVSLVDTHRQWFKSNHGLAASETARDLSFCGHAILGTTTFVIENAREDARFVPRLRNTADTHNTDEGRASKLSFSAAICAHRADRHTCLHDVLNEADGQMYTHKRAKQRPVAV